MAAINARHPGVAAPPVRLLPTNLAPEAVGALYRGPDQVVIGQREEDLAPVVLDFAENPLLMVFGDSKSGKTTLLRHIIRTIREHSTRRPGGLHRAGSAAAPRRRAAVPRQRIHRQYRPDHPGDARAGQPDRVAAAAGGLVGGGAVPVDLRGPHPLPDHRRRRPDAGFAGDERPVRRTAAVDSASSGCSRRPAIWGCG